MRFKMLMLCLLHPLAACASQFPPPPQSTAHVDHVIVGAADLEMGIDQIERLTGVRPVFGGSHPGRGTRNALMSLGDSTYLELLAPDPAQAVDNAELSELRALTKLTPIGWAVSGKSELGLRHVLRAKGVSLSASEPGSRKKPDGSMLRWVTFAYENPDDPLLPFFIIWSDPAAHPSRTSPGGCGLRGIGIHHHAADRIGEAISPLGLGVTITKAPAPRMIVQLQCRGRGLFLG